MVQIERAEPPAEASSPKPVQNTVIGAIVGLALGLALAIALERRDRRVRDPRFMEYVLGGPIIGRIPRSRALARSGRGTRALPAPRPRRSGRCASTSAASSSSRASAR